jgi:hypothetical protein
VIGLQSTILRRLPRFPLAMKGNWCRGVVAVLLSIAGGCGVEPGDAPTGGVSTSRSALSEPTIDVTLDPDGYLGSLNLGDFGASYLGASHPVTLTSGQYAIWAPITADLEGRNTPLATLFVDAAAGTIRVSPSSIIAPVAPGDRTVHLRTILFPYDPRDTGAFSVALWGVGWFSGAGHVSDVRVFDNRRYQMVQTPSWTRDGFGDLFSHAPDVAVRQGCAEIAPDQQAGLSFTVHGCRLAPRLSEIMVAPGTDFAIGLLGVYTLPPGHPVKVISERLYRLTGPGSVDIDTGRVEYSDRGDLYVSANGPETTSFIDGTKASRLFAVRNHMITPDKTATVTFDPAGSITELDLGPTFNIDPISRLAVGRRYQLNSMWNWDPDDLFSQQFIDGRFGAVPGLTITEDGALQVTDAITKNLLVDTAARRLTAKVGTVHITVHDIKQKVKIDDTVLHGSECDGKHLEFKMLLGRLHHVGVVGSDDAILTEAKFLLGFDGHCTPGTITFPKATQGSLTVSCSL